MLTKISSLLLSNYKHCLKIEKLLEIAFVYIIRLKIFSSLRNHLQEVLTVVFLPPDCQSHHFCNQVGAGGANIAANMSVISVA